MKVVIEAGNTKRKIDGPFNICGSADDLRQIATLIHKALESDMSYGWVFVHDTANRLGGVPQEWDTPTTGGQVICR